MKSPGYSGRSTNGLCAIALLLIALIPSLRAQPIITSQPRSVIAPLGMDVRFKETAQGGLAATPTGRKLAELVWAEKQAADKESD